MQLVLCSYARVRTRQSSELGLKFVAMDLLKKKKTVPVLMKTLLPQCSTSYSAVCT